SGVIGTLNLVTTGMLTDNAPLALAIAATSTLATAYFTSRHRTITATTAREASHHTLAENSTANLIDRLTSMHREQIENKEREIQRITIENALVRVSKHNALGALQAAYWHLFEVNKICNQAGVQLPPFRKIPNHEIFGEEDRQLQEILSEDLDAFKNDQSTPLK
ncbi:MAG: hypothetical protein M3Y86_11515, partial [Verrucomicrobiota bacterium]|nr:hypothetical protein [Verrucomicrobiota bacterium]